MSGLDKFFADLGVAVMHGDILKVEIMKEANAPGGRPLRDYGERAG